MTETRTARQPSFMTGLALLFPITLSVMAALFVAPIAPKIAETFGPTGEYGKDLGFYVGWIVTVPALCVALFSVPAGALGDRVGRRRLLIWSMVLYVVIGVAPYHIGLSDWTPAFAGEAPYRTTSDPRESCSPR